MRITTVDIFIEEFRNGRDIWSRGSVELAVREIERLRKLVQIKDDSLQSYADFYDKAAALCGNQDANPCTEMDEIILKTLHHGVSG